MNYAEIRVMAMLDLVSDPRQVVCAADERIDELEGMLRYAALDYVHDGELSPNEVDSCAHCQAWLSDLRARLTAPEGGK